MTSRRMIFTSAATQKTDLPHTLEPFEAFRRQASPAPKAGPPASSRPDTSFAHGLPTPTDDGDVSHKDSYLPSPVVTSHSLLPPSSPSFNGWLLRVGTPSSGSNTSNNSSSAGTEPRLRTPSPDHRAFTFPLAAPPPTSNASQHHHRQTPPSRLRGLRASAAAAIATPQSSFSPRGKRHSASNFAYGGYGYAGYDLQEQKRCFHLHFFERCTPHDEMGDGYTSA